MIPTVDVIFDWSAFRWESAEIRAVGSAVDALYSKDVWKYLGITGDEYIHIRSVDISRTLAATERAGEEPPPRGIAFINIEEVRSIGFPRDFLEFKVQFVSYINDNLYNILFFVGMIMTRYIKSIEYVDIELIQHVPEGLEIREAKTLPGYSKERMRLT